MPLSVDCRAPLRTAALLVALSAPLIAFGAAMTTPDIKLNPNPRMRYEITATVEGAPGPFESIEAAVDYKVTDRHCVPLTPVTGAAMFPEKRVPIKLEHAGDNVYRGEIYIDLLKDEDYFGKGVCHWGVVGAGFSFKAGKVSFASDVFHDDILSGRQEVRFFSKRSYATQTVDRVDTGNARREDFENEAPQTFSITVRSEERLP